MIMHCTHGFARNFPPTFQHDGRSVPVIKNQYAREPKKIRDDTSVLSAVLPIKKENCYLA